MIPVHHLRSLSRVPSSRLKKLNSERNYCSNVHLSFSSIWIGAKGETKRIQVCALFLLANFNELKIKKKKKKKEEKKKKKNREMDESMSGDRERQHRSAEINTGQKQGATCLNMANYATSNEACNLSTIPKRKLSVFYRSFDVIAQIDQEKEKETLDFRRTSSSPSVRIEGIREDNDSNDNDEADQQTSLHKRKLVTYRSLIESEKFLSGSSPDRLSEKPSSNNGQASKVGSLSPKTIELSQVREDTIVDNYSTITETSIGKRYKLNNNGNYSELKVSWYTQSALISIN